MVTRKASVYKSLDVKMNNLNAADLHSRLKILYNVSLLSFMYHLDQANFVKKQSIAQTQASKNTMVKMQFPQIEEWDVNLDIQLEMEKDSERVNSAPSARDSITSGGYN